jgi:hypothetical protein
VWIDGGGEVKAQPREAYARFTRDPCCPSLHFKRIHSSRPIFSVRVGIHDRAVGVVEGEQILWLWIGSHAEYDDLVKRI